MNVTLLAHTQLSGALLEKFNELESVDVYYNLYDARDFGATTDGQIVALAAIRQCYSHKTAMEVLETESAKYLGDGGKEGKRLFDHIMKSKHTSTMEHIHFTFAVEGVSRALLAQLTRHRQLSFSVQSQRYNSFSSDSRSGGFDYVVPESIENKTEKFVINTGDGLMPMLTPKEVFDEYMMPTIQEFYDKLIEMGIPQEDARAVLPNAAACNLVTSGNLRSWLEFYNKRKKGNGAQHEIAEFAERIKDAIVVVEPWTKDYFEM